VSRVIDRLRTYIVDRKESGHFNVGDKLPSYHELKEMFSTSYATVRSAMAALQEEGLVDLVHGNGTFIAGSRLLDIEIYYQQTTPFPKEFSEIIDKYIKRSGLHLRVSLKDVSEIISYEKSPYPTGSCRAVIVVCPAGANFIMGASSFVEYPDYREVMNELEVSPDSERSASIPFFYFGQQMAFNERIMRETGLNAEDLTGDFKWWGKYAGECAKRGYSPISFRWDREAKWTFYNLYNLWLSLKVNEIDPIENIYELSKPYFNCSSGRTLLQVFKDSSCEAAQDEAFYDGSAGMISTAGSWIALAVKNGRLDKVCEDGLKIVPFKKGNRKIHSINANTLKTCFNPDASTEEKNRIWNFIKLLVSKEFQKDFCSISGALSVRKDMKASDYAWYAPQYAEFLPGKDDIIVNNVFDREQKAYLTALVEQFKFYGADRDTILKCMDHRL
jgi:DNA-binding transcriptional regulator YhcF (GntR family)